MSSSSDHTSAVCPPVPAGCLRFRVAISGFHVPPGHLSVSVAQLLSCLIDKVPPLSHNHPLVRLPLLDASTRTDLRSKHGWLYCRTDRRVLELVLLCSNAKQNGNKNHLFLSAAEFCRRPLCCNGTCRATSHPEAPPRSNPTRRTELETIPVK